MSKRLKQRRPNTKRQAALLAAIVATGLGWELARHNWFSAGLFGLWTVINVVWA